MYLLKVLHCFLLITRSVWVALVTPHAQPAARAPNETLSGNHHILSSRAREHCTPSKISRLLHGKLEGGELQVNSIVPLLTFGLFARTWVCRSLTYSTLLLHSLCLHSYESYIHSYVKVMLGLSAWSAIWHVFAELRMEWNFVHFQFFSTNLRTWTTCSNLDAFNWFEWIIINRADYQTRIIIINKDDYLVLWSGVDRRDWHLPGNVVVREMLDNVVQGLLPL